MAIAILIGGVLAIFLAASLAALVAYCIVTELITQQFAAGAVPIIIAISVFVAALVASVNASQPHKIVAALGSAGIYMIACILVKLAFFPGSIDNMLRNVIICFAAAFAAALLGSRGGKGRA